MSIRSGQFAVGTSPVELLPQSPVVPAGSSSSVVVQGASTADVFVGPSGVTTSTGLKLVTNGALSFTLQAGESLFAVAASAGPHTVSVLRSDF